MLYFANFNGISSHQTLITQIQHISEYGIVKQVRVHRHVMPLSFIKEKGWIYNKLKRIAYLSHFNKRNQEAMATKRSLETAIKQYFIKTQCLSLEFLLSL